ncbi:putative lipoprotein [Neisseria gonorrhoeae]|uniref:Putative lipoprotein n=1 Tax=Neisseria gonorrhoeae TaxID=485 RepID=A0A378VX71_NEIGO|nr:putative lipoprotein [Neisseria gonorrhoeae]
MAIQPLRRNDESETLGRLSLCAAVLALTACGGGHKTCIITAVIPIPSMKV